jgi:hypothetical protein
MAVNSQKGIGIVSEIGIVTGIVIVSETETGTGIVTVTGTVIEIGRETGIATRTGTETGIVIEEGTGTVIVTVIATGTATEIGIGTEKGAGGGIVIEIVTRAGIETGTVIATVTGTETGENLSITMRKGSKFLVHGQTKCHPHSSKERSQKNQASSKGCVAWPMMDTLVLIEMKAEVHLVVVTQGRHLHHAETEVPLQKGAVREMDLQWHRMLLHLCWTYLRSRHQQFRKVVPIETLMQPRVIRGLQDHGSRAPEDPLAQVVPCLVQGVQGLMDSGHLALKVSGHHQAQDSGLIVSDHLVNSHVVAHPQRE